MRTKFKPLRELPKPLECPQCDDIPSYCEKMFVSCGRAQSINCIELGLRWLNDRSKQHIFEQDSCGCETLHGILIQCSKHYNQ